MKKILAGLALFAFLLVGCQNNSSIVEPDMNSTTISKTTNDKDVPTKKVKVNNEGMGQNGFPRP